MLYKNVGTSFFHFVTIHASDRRIDGQTGRQTNRQTDGQKGLRNVYRTLHYMQSQGKIVPNRKWVISKGRLKLKIAYNHDVSSGIFRI